MKYLIVGLGNIGPEYDFTRHNIGFDMADSFVIKHQGRFNLERLAFRAVVKVKGKTFVVIKPSTYMNLSGKAVKYWMEKENIPIERTLVMLDDLALPLHVLRLKASGSDAGHNGLKNIQLFLNTQQYPRLKFGIGNNFPKGMQVDFVLGKWSSDELPLVKEKILKSIDMIESFAFQGIDRTMNQFNN